MARSKAKITGKVITIDYEPRDWADKFHENPKRFKVLVLHRRAGKTTAVLHHLQRDAFANKDTRYAYIAPTYKQAKNIAWDLIKGISRDLPGTEYNEVELKVKYLNGSIIQLYGADNPDSLRGIGLWGVVFDEYSQQPSNIFTEIIGPALSDHQGYAIWIGTPKGKNEFYRLYNQAVTGSDKEGVDVSEDWFGLLLPASLSGIIPEAELALWKRNMSSDEFAQEYECSFDASVRGAYYSDEVQKARAEGRISGFNYDPSVPVFTVWDLGIGDATAIGFYQKVNQEVRMIDYYEMSDKGLNWFAKILRDKEYVYSRHFAPHDIKVRELGSGKSRLEIARELGINFDIVPQMDVDDGINAGRLVFPRLYINLKNCITFVDYISQYHKEWDDKKGMFKERAKHDFTSHAADVHRYMAIVESQFNNESFQEDYQLYNSSYN